MTKGIVWAHFLSCIVWSVILIYALVEHLMDRGLEHLTHLLLFALPLLATFLAGIYIFWACKPCLGSAPERIIFLHDSQTVTPPCRRAKRRQAITAVIMVLLAIGTLVALHFLRYVDHDIAIAGIGHSRGSFEVREVVHYKDDGGFTHLAYVIQLDPDDPERTAVVVDSTLKTAANHIEKGEYLEVLIMRHSVQNRRFLSFMVLEPSGR